MLRAHNQQSIYICGAYNQVGTFQMRTSYFFIHFNIICLIA